VQYDIPLKIVSGLEMSPISGDSSEAEKDTNARETIIIIIINNI